MKSLLFCTSFISGNEAWETRYQRWLDYYRDVPINAVKKIMIDDGSPFLPSASLIKTISHTDPVAAETDAHLIVRFDNNLGRQSIKDYPGWWRSFLHSIEIADELGVDKIIHIESDAFILSPQLVEFLNQVRDGWHVLWSPHNDFPETAIQVICRDQFDIFRNFKQKNPELRFHDFAERVLPFTDVHREFKGDRYSEFKRNRGIFRSKKFNFLPIFEWDFFNVPVPPDADFATQGVTRQKLAYRRHG
ncbi:hypothetical protein GTP55_24450 [Duganella sp. FT109W]|uniref:Glycosyltransferase n=1 Tax=Duganella margarita TaxID=2692170 RepID=A0ABW9WMP7_9BURK|nr:hypothetical protein [Duganella margarita]MYN42496.1 hypothetical protein [Duganella margarita]